MNRKKKIILITIIILSVLGIIIVNVWNSARYESDSISRYALALESYKSKDYKKAYSEFGHVSAKSTLKSAAIYRQAKCAEFMHNDKLAIKNYKKLLRNYSQFGLNSKIEYLLAQNMYSKSPQKSKKLFTRIIKRYPDSDYAVASKYYLGLIQIIELKGVQNKTKLIVYSQKASDYFKEYLENAPSGRFALSSINKIIELAPSKLSNDECLIIARAYHALGEYDLARQYFDKTDLAQSWCDIVKNYSKLRNNLKIKEITEKGIVKSSSNINLKDLYVAVDLYLNANSDNKQTALTKLSSLVKEKPGEDYVMYLKCKNTPSNVRDICYSELYYKFPNGQFSADALSNVFFMNIINGKYNYAKKLGEVHLSNFPDVNSTPFVLFWLGKTEAYLKNYESANNYYKKVIENYPDSYYAYRAYLHLYKIKKNLFAKKLVYKPVVFPYEKSKQGNLVLKLALLKDYALVDELCKNDKFVQSWLAYQNESYTESVILARDAMTELKHKPAKDDFRWRLVYPMHYYNDVLDFALNNNPIILLSIIKEESHFNPKATSIVGAMGLMQLMPQTANEVKQIYDINENIANLLYNPRVNIQLGSTYYSKIRSLFNNDFYAVLAYNGGAASVNNWRNSLNYSDEDTFLEQIPYT